MDYGALLLEPMIGVAVLLPCACSASHLLQETAALIPSQACSRG